MTAFSSASNISRNSRWKPDNPWGDCRIDATATTGVWRVRYYNSADTLILDTFEVTDVPEVACAAPEDIADSAERLADILAALR